MGGFLGGLLSSLMGQSGSGNSSNSSTSNSSGSQSSNGQSTVTPNENPIFTMFRTSILPAIAQQYSDAQKPVYGDAQTAQFTNQQNNVYQQALQGAQGNAARRGVLNSGAMDAAANNLDLQRAGQISNFYSQIPLLNQQAKFNNTQSLLGLATSFLGQSPIGSTTVGNNNSNFNQTQTGTSTGSQSSSQNPSLFGIPL